MPNLLRAKCIVVGDSTCGKSSVCQVFHSDNSFFPKNYTMTTGVELLVKQVNIPDTKDSVELYLYDAAGKELFSDYVSKFFDHPSLIAVVYDCTSESSFSSCEKWIQRVRHESPDFHIPERNARS
ncbi:Intraflagellar transport protein 27 [Mactra antiquata]